MFDAALRPMIDRILDPAGRRLAAAGISANQVTLAGFVCGIGAACAIVVGWTATAVTLLILNRFLSIFHIFEQFFVLIIQPCLPGNSRIVNAR